MSGNLTIRSFLVTFPREQISEKELENQQLFMRTWRYWVIREKMYLFDHRLKVGK